MILPPLSPSPSLPVHPLQLESRLSELTREKTDLESRVEEDQDEIEDLTGKQRSLISQNTQLQTQLSEAFQRSAELEEVKLGLESKVISHTYTECSVHQMQWLEYITMRAYCTYSTTEWVVSRIID